MLDMEVRMQELKTKHFSFIMSPRERRALQNLSDLEEVSLATVLRRLIRAEARQRDAWPEGGTTANARRAGTVA